MYYSIKKYNKEILFDFFTRVEISHYTKEEADKYNEDYVKYNYKGDKRKVGQKYLKETDVIINLRTGEEVNIEIPKQNGDDVRIPFTIRTKDGYALKYDENTGNVVYRFSNILINF